MKPIGFPTRRRHWAVTLTELLVVLAIIGLLATVAVPGYLNHIQTAKARVAYLECKQIAEAEIAVALAHGFFVPFCMLDDVASPGDVNTDSLDYDDIYNTANTFANLYLVDPFVRPEIQENNQLQLDQYNQATDFNIRVSNLYHKWAGPFMQFKRVYTGREFLPNIPEALTDEQRAFDWPLDPWGNPYRFLAPNGYLIGQQSDADLRNPVNYSNRLEDEEFGNGELVDGFTAYELDRYAIVSFGPDGIEGDPAEGDNTEGSVTSPNNDDILYFFGGIVNESAYRLF